MLTNSPYKTLYESQDYSAKVNSRSFVCMDISCSCACFQRLTYFITSNIATLLARYQSIIVSHPLSSSNSCLTLNFRLCKRHTYYILNIICVECVSCLVFLIFNTLLELNFGKYVCVVGAWFCDVLFDCLYFSFPSAVYCFALLDVFFPAVLFCWLFISFSQLFELSLLVGAETGHVCSNPDASFSIVYCLMFIFLFIVYCLLFIVYCFVLAAV